MAPAEKGRKRNGKVEIKTAEEVLEEKQSKSKAKSEQDTELRISRVSFGIEKLNEALEGGVPKGSWVVIGGEPGTGKSIMAIHFAAAGLSAKDKIIYVTTEQEFFDVVQQAKQFNIDLATCRILNLASIVEWDRRDRE